MLCALTLLRTITEHADDSSGAIGGECERAADLYAQACRLGEPDPAELAGWLATFRATSPGWPTLLLADFVDVFDDHALAIYRAAVADLDRQHAGRDHWGRFEVDAMLLELADHDGDVDRAVDLLNERERPQYGAIIARLRAAGRDDEVVNWIDRAVAEGRASSQGGGSGYWLSTSDVADTYRGIGRIDDAIAVLRADFVRQPAVHAYRSLLDFAATIGRADAERVWRSTTRETWLAAARGRYGPARSWACLDPTVQQGELPGPALTERGRRGRRRGGRRPLWFRLGMAGTRYVRRRGSAGSRCRSVLAATRERPPAP